MMAAPAFAVDSTDNPSNDRPTRDEARAIGTKECQEFKANFGENKSQFGKCVSASVKTLRTATTPRQACRQQDLARKPAEGERRSDFSACVEAAGRAQRDQQQA